MKRFLLAAAIAISLDAWSITAVVKPIAQPPVSAAPSSSPVVATPANPEKLVIKSAQPITPAATPEVKASNDSSSKSEGENGHWWDWVTAGSTFALAIITLGLAVATGFLAWFTAKLWRATGQLVTEDKKTSEQELRAYIRVKPTALMTANSGAEFIAIEFECRNEGHTPASEITVYAEARELPFPLAQDYAVPFSTTALPARSVLFRNDQIRFPAVIKIPVRGSTPGKALHLLCRIDYLDIFEKPHSTYHVSYITSRGRMLAPERWEIDSAFASTGNKIT